MAGQHAGGFLSDAKTVAAQPLPIGQSQDLRVKARQRHTGRAGYVQYVFRNSHTKRRDQSRHHTETPGQAQPYGFYDEHEFHRVVAVDLVPMAKQQLRRTRADYGFHKWGLVSANISRMARRSASERCANSSVTSCAVSTSWSRRVTYPLTGCGSWSNNGE